MSANYNADDAARVSRRVAIGRGLACLCTSLATGFLVIWLVTGAADSARGAGKPEADDSDARAEILKLELRIQRARLRARLRDQFDMQLKAREEALKDGTSSLNQLAEAMRGLDTARADAERWRIATDPKASPEEKAGALKEIRAETQRKRQERMRAGADPVESDPDIGRVRKDLMTAGVSRNRRIEILEQVYGKTVVQSVLKEWTPAKLADMDIDESDVEKLVSLHGETVIQEVLGQVSGPRCLESRPWIGVESGPFVSYRGGRVGIRTENKEGDDEMVYVPMEKLHALDQAYVKNKVKPRTWTSSNAQYTVRASLLEFRNGLVHLAKNDGAVVKVPVMKLSEKDREFLKR